MSLIDHARANRILGQAFAEESTNPQHPLDRRMILRAIGAAHHAAADQMEAAMREEAEHMAEAHRCTLDHAALTTPRCPACGSAKG